MVFFSSRISPFTSTVILRDKSPRATAVATSAMLRTWPVKLPAIEFTESVRSFHLPATPGTVACPERSGHVPDVAHLARKVRRHRIHRVRKVGPCSGHPGPLGLAAQLAV